MNDAVFPSSAFEAEGGIPPLVPKPKKAPVRQVLAVAVLGLSVLAVLGFVAYKAIAKRTEAPAQRPDAAATATPKVQFSDTPPAPTSAPPTTLTTSDLSAPAGKQSPVAVPGIESTKSEAIPVKSTGTPNHRPAQGATPEGDESPFPLRSADPSLSSASRDVVTYPDTPTGAAQANLRRYQDQLGGVVAQLKSLSDKASAPSGSNIIGSFQPLGQQSQAGTPVAGVLGSLERSATATVLAKHLLNRSLTIPKGSVFLCSLKTRVVTSASGFVGCQLERNVLSEDGKVVLAERGSHLDGEYRIVQVRPGTTRIPVLWTRLRTPHGVVVDLDSPATGGLGESGIEGYVDNRWPERIGAALLVSLIDDAIKVASSDASSSASSTVLLPSTANAGSKLAERVLEATINIPPLIYQNQGSTVGVYAARDLDFSHVYSLVPQ